MEPIDALRMLVAARKGLTAGPYHALHRKLLPYLRHTTRLELPYILTYPVPAADRRVRTRLRQRLQQEMRTQRIPAPLRAYYMAILTVPLTTGCTIKSALSDNYMTAGLESMRQDMQRSDKCACTTHTTCQHTTLHGVKDIQNAVMDKFHDIVAAPTNAKIQPSVSQVYRVLRMNTEGLYRKMPAMHKAPAKELVHYIAKEVLHTRRVERPGTDPPP